MIATTSYTDSITFALCTVVIISGAFGVVLSNNPVRAVLNLIMTLFGIAVLFLELNADFLAAVQVIIYAGAIVVLFLFVIMLLGVDKHENLSSEPLVLQRVVAVVVGLAFLGMIIGYGWGNFNSHGSYSVIGQAKGGDSGVLELARATFTYYLLPFEVTSVLLIIAVIGAVVLIARSGLADEEVDTSEAKVVDLDGGNNNYNELNQADSNLINGENSQNIPNSEADVTEADVLIEQDELMSKNEDLSVLVSEGKTEESNSTSNLSSKEDSHINEEQTVK